MPAFVLRTALVVAFSAIALAQAQAADPARVAETSKGPALIDAAKGMTLYTFDKDAAGKSACNGQCATNWPPLMSKGGMASGNYSVIARDDGSKQWAYKGKPLYTWVKDTKPGDVTGDGVRDVWHIAKP